MTWKFVLPIPTTLPMLGPGSWEGEGSFYKGTEQVSTEP